MRHNFNPRSPHGERPPWSVFLQILHDFNPRSPHGERLSRTVKISPPVKISIHAPRMGSDLPLLLRQSPGHRFQSTLPAWGATAGYRRRTGPLDYFNPRSPHGERRCLVQYKKEKAEFQSTLPAWGATLWKDAHKTTEQISIHAPRMGSDAAAGDLLPCIFFISIHAPRMGSDLMMEVGIVRYLNFNPRSPHGERQAIHVVIIGRDKNFNPRSPHGERHGSLFTNFE